MSQGTHSVRRNLVVFSSFVLLAFVTTSVFTVSLYAQDEPAGVMGDAYSVGTLATNSLSYANTLTTASTDLSSGTAKAVLPFNLSAARGKAQPELGLHYSSTSGVREAGLGWGLDLPSIERRNLSGPPFYLDPSMGQPLDPNVEDQFVFSGQPLVPICLVTQSGCLEPGGSNGEAMPEWAGGWHYFRLHVEGAYIRFFWSPDHRTWRAQFKSGETMELGVALEGPAGDELGVDIDDAVSQQARGNIFRWNVVRRYDAQARICSPRNDIAASFCPTNVVVYVWSKLGQRGIGFLTDIYDTPSVKGGMSVANYAHHTHLTYQSDPVPLVSNAPIWKATPDLLLTTVDVASANIAGSGPRELVRRYHLSYSSTLVRPTLMALQLEGRCNSPIIEDQTTGHLPAVTQCLMFPAINLSYTTPVMTPANWTTMHGSMLQIPFETTIADLNADGLPDLIQPAGLPTYNQNVSLNSTGTVEDTLEPVGMSIHSPTAGADASSLLKPGSGVGILGDWTGDGRVGVVWISKDGSIRDYDCYSATNLGGLRWDGGDCGKPKPKFDLIGDIDGDGLIDSYSLNGTASFTTKNSGAGVQIFARLSTGHLNPGGDSLIDMNGDGLPDLVMTKPPLMLISTGLRYSAGNGLGDFGCHPVNPQCIFSSNDLNVVMEGFPSGLASSQIYLHDINGDGLADLIVCCGTDSGEFPFFRVYLNQDGKRFGSPITVSWPFSADLFTINYKIAFADMNGSGVDDLVLMTGEGPGGTSVSYIDMLGGQQPGLLTDISNGTGVTTHIEYGKITDLARAARQAGAPWRSESPQVLRVVTRITVRNNLSQHGEKHITEYSYRDPIYDGWEHTSRGFRNVRVTKVGDSDGPSSVSDYTFLPAICNPLGETCPDDRDTNDPNKTVYGMPVLVEISDGAGTYLSTQHTTYKVDRLYWGMDGSSVLQAYPAVTDTYLYDTTLVKQNPGGPIFINDLILNDEFGLHVYSRNIALRSTSGLEHVQTERFVDRWGNEYRVLDSGRLNNQGPIDDPIIRDYKIQMVSPLTQWLWRVTESTTTPFPQNVLSAEDHSHHFTFSYDAFGNLTDVYGDLVGTMPLDRFHENPAKPFAPPPAQASKDGSVHLLHMTYDSVGNVTQTKGTNAACSEVVFDPIYRQLAVEKTVFTGGCTPLGGGTGPLTVIRDFDRGLGLVTHITDPTGAIAKFEYEPFGRVRAVYAPDPANLGKTGIQPAITMQYIDGNSVTQPVHTRVRDSATTWRDSWVLTDGFGRVVLTFRPADPSGGDGGQWIAGGLSDHSANGLLTRNYEPWFFTGDPSQLPGDPSQTVSPPAHSLSVVYDAFGRISKRIGFDGNTTSLYKYHALSVDIYDAANLGANGTPVTVRRNGHGRIIEVSAILREQGRPVNTISTHMRYLSNGEVTNITQSRSPSLGYDNIVRWMQYDSFGRLVLNSEPNTSVNFKPSPANSGGMKAWRYAYNDRGDLVGSSDARGCGANFSYDGVGRIVAEDYSPCLVSQPDYSPPDPTSGDGTETLYRYDAPEPGQTEDFGGNAAFLVGRLVSVSDRGAHTRFAYDGRGRVTGVARQLAKPGDPSVALTDRYAPWWYRVATSYDEVDRIISQTTGADVPDLLGLQGGSIVNFDYTARGIIKDIGGSYGVLLKNETRDADGLALGEEYGDVASTHTVRMYDTSRRPVGYWLSRSAPMLWSAPTGSYTPPSSNPSTLPLLLESNIWSYDDVGNIKSVTDGRNQGEWPAGAKPVSRTLEYDSFNRLSSVLSEYGPNGDIQVLPFAAEVANGDKSPVPASIFPKRIQSQSFTWDWKGNMSASDDDTHRLWDRSLGQIVNGQPSNRPNALFSAGPGIISSYDAAGNLVNLVLRRQGTCEGPTNDCSQRFDYDWDEVGQLARARRWDYSAIPSNEPLYPAAPSAPMAFDISYKYSIGSRVLKSVLDSSGSQLHSAQIFSSLRLVRAKWDSTLNTYERSPETEAVYLAGLGRLYYSRQNLPSLTGSSLHVLLEFPDRLGSTSTVIDRDTSELIEKITYEATGAPESDYRPDRWGNFREAYRLNGKEDDIEIGLVYFGARYYHPSLGRWISPDPLAVHSFRGDLNPYAYVGGSPLQFVDPRGLCTDLGKEKQCNDQSDGSGDGDGYESGSGSTGDGGNGGGYRSGYCDVFGCAAPGPPPPPPPSCTACGVYDVALNQFFAGTWQGAMAQVNKDFADTARGLRDSVISAVQGLFARPKVVERLIGPNPVFSLLEGLKVAPSERTGPYSAGMILGSIGMVLIPGMGEEKTVTELEILGSGKPYPIQASSAAQGALLRQQLAAEEAAGLQMPRSLTGYRYHGLDQAISREGVGVSHEAIFDAWQNPVNIAGQSGGRFLIQGRNADIVVNSEGQIITTWAHGSTGFRGAP